VVGAAIARIKPVQIEVPRNGDPRKNGKNGGAPPGRALVEAGAGVSRAEFDRNDLTPLPDPIPLGETVRSTVVSSRGAQVASASGELSSAAARGEVAIPAREIVTISPRRTGPIEVDNIEPELWQEDPPAERPPPVAREAPLLRAVALAVVGAGAVALAIAGLFGAFHRDRERTDDRPAAVRQPLASSRAVERDHEPVRPTPTRPAPPAVVAPPVVAPPDAGPGPAAVAPPADQVRDLLSEARKLRRRRKPDEALVLVDRAISVRQSSAAYALRADLLLSLGDKPGALDAASRAVELAPRSASAWRSKGTVLYDLEHYSAARAAFERYLEISPSARDGAEIRTLIDSM
jgi:hypothetical protein